MAVVGVLGDLTIFAFVAAVAVQILYAASRWLDAQPELSGGVALAIVPESAQLACAVSGLVIALTVAERMLPLQAVSREKWVYRDRPRGELTTLDAIAMGQIAVAALMGAVVGLAHRGLFGINSVVVVAGCAVVVGMVRLALGLRRNVRLSRVLSAGDSRVFYSASIFLRDSELASKAIAATWWRPRGSGVVGPSSNLVRIFARRLGRRSYLWMSMLSAVLLAIGVARLSPGMVGIVLSGFWLIASAGVCRAADVSELGVHSLLPRIVALALSLFGALIIAAIAVGSSFAGVLVWPGVLAVGLFAGIVSRSGPRTGNSGVLMDTGAGFSIDPEVVGYFSRGFRWLAVALVIAHFSAGSCGGLAL